MKGQNRTSENYERAAVGFGSWMDMAECLYRPMIEGFGDVCNHAGVLVTFAITRGVIHQKGKGSGEFHFLESPEDVMIIIICRILYGQYLLGIIYI